MQEGDAPTEQHDSNNVRLNQRVGHSFSLIDVIVSNQTDDGEIYLVIQNSQPSMVIQNDVDQM